MLKLYIFWGIFGAVILGVIVTLVRDRRHRARARLLHAQSQVPSPASPRQVSPTAKSPNPDGAPGQAAPATAPAQGAAFDPVATKVFARPEATTPAHELRGREGKSAPKSGNPTVVCVGGKQKGHRYPISGIGLTIGRASDNDVIIIDGRVSSHHAWIGLIKGRVVLRDYQSLNGTFLNAQMDVPVSEVALIDGDTIFFGGHGGEQYRFVLE